MKNVWILNHYAQEPGDAGITRHFSLARHLLKHGWRASVIAASVDHHTGRQRLTSLENKRSDNFEGVPFLWVRTPEYNGNGVGRITNMLVYTFRVLMPGITRELERPDVIVGSSVHPFAALAGLHLARRFRVPFVFEVRDLWPQTLIDFGRLKEKSLVSRTLHFLEKHLYRQAARVVVVLPQAHKYICPLGIPPQRIVWIPNGVELEGYPEPYPPALRDTFNLMYFGAHGQANGLDTLLKAMAELQSRPEMSHVRLRLIGNGPLKPDLIHLAAKLELKNVVFEDPIPKGDIPRLAAEADAFVILVRDLPGLYRFGISMNKLFDYLAGARPIVIAVNASNNPIDEAKAGVTVPPENPSALAEGIASLVTMPVSERIAMGRAGRAYVKRQHGFDRLAGNFGAMLDEVLTEES